MVNEITEDEGPTVVLDDLEDEMFESPASKVIADITSKYQQTKSHRLEAEYRWLKAYTNFRGRYSEDVQFLRTETSRAFIKITKTKTLAAYGQILDVLLGGPQFPISVEPTEKPDGVSEAVHVDPNQTKDITPTQKASMGFVDEIGFAGDGNDVRADESRISRRLRIIQEKLGLGDTEVEIQEGGANEPGKITLDPAAEAARRMTTKIQDQLTESNMTHEFRKFLFETVLLGSGCLKGPLYTEKEYPKWDDEGNYTPDSKVVPVSKFVSVWNIYPDNNATSVKDAEWLIERHRMSKIDFLNLKKQPFFRGEAIENACRKGANYVDEFWEQTIKEGNDRSTENRYEVFEYWGVMDVDKLLDIEGLDLTEEQKEMDQININAFVCNGSLIRLIVNPFKPVRIPYFICPYEEDPYNFFGVGLPENMEDSQTLMNGMTRMAVDNAVLSGNVILEIDEDALSPGQSPELYPGKIFRRQSGNPGTAVNAIQIPNVSPQLMQMYDKFRQLSDESTGVSSFSHGQTGVSGIGRTAAGISMLMNAASNSTKTVIKNIDDYALEPLGQAYFAFNMQFDFDPTMAGDIQVKAQGASSLLQKEVSSQRLLQLISVTSADPEMSARLNKEYIIKEIARSLELDPNKVTLSQEEAALNAVLFPSQQTPTNPGGEVIPSVGDTTGGGGGNIGVGAPALPGEPQFSGNTGGTLNV